MRASLPVTLVADEIRVGPNVCLSFQRTLRIPDDGRHWPLPPGLGRFPLRRIADCGDRVPAAWREEGGFLLPMYQREAMWIAFEGAHWRPNAVKVGLGAVDAISGGPWDRRLHADPQDYVVVKTQPWLDGINAGTGFIRQFVAAPLGRGLTVEAQVAGREDGGLRLAVFEPKPGRFPTRAPARSAYLAESMMYCMEAPMELGLGAGGRMVQAIYADDHGIDTWDQQHVTEVRLRIVNSEQWAEITGEAAPGSPVSAEAYMEAGLPWYALYDEGRVDVAPSQVLAGVKSIGELQGVDATPVDGSAPQVPVIVLPA